VKAASLGRATQTQGVLLAKLGFAKATFAESLVTAPDRNFVLTPPGEAFDEAWSVYGERRTAQGLLYDAVLALGPTQSLVQALHGRGNVAVAGALHLLAKHNLADADDVTAFRGFLQTLNDLGIVAYSKKLQTVRVTAEMPQRDDDAPDPTLRVIQPERPYQNVRHLREVLRACREYIWWAEPNFTKKMFEPLQDEADGTKVKEIRILSGPSNSPMDLSDFKRFVAEMKTLGITVAWRSVEMRDRDWHDRFIVTHGTAWNVPPVNSLYKNDYSEITQTTRPPFETWWNKAKPVT
jgi:hypothetical protein